MHDTAAAGVLLDRAAAEGWTPRRVKVDGTYTGARMAQAAKPYGVEVQVTTRERDEGLQALAPALAHRGHLRHPDQPLSPPHSGSPRVGVSHRISAMSTEPFQQSGRRLSMREMARLQTFPDDVVVTGDVADAQQLGDAVPSLMAEILASGI